MIKRRVHQIPALGHRIKSLFVTEHFSSDPFLVVRVQYLNMAA